ncbi:MAG: DUF881 domain-containing protein [Patescibacteria group bacterium]
MPKKIDFKKTKTLINRSLYALIGIIIGMLIILQSKVLPTRVTNSVAPYLSLKDTKDLLYSEQANLKNEVADLQGKVNNLSSNLAESSLAPQETLVLNQKREQAGLTKLNGPGIIITLDDSTTGPVSDDSIVHAADLRDIINLLWGSTAEGISVNGERVVSSTSIDCIVNTILINDAKISNPFKIEVIGDQGIMYDRLQDQNILADLHKRVKNFGLKFYVEKNTNIILPAFSGTLPGMAS